MLNSFNLFRRTEDIRDDSVTTSLLKDQECGSLIKEDSSSGLPSQQETSEVQDGCHINNINEQIKIKNLQIRFLFSHYLL